MGRIRQLRWCLLGFLIAVVVLAAVSVFIPGTLTDSVKWLASNGPADRLRGLVRQDEIPEDRLVEVVVEKIGVSQISYQPVVVLKQKDEELYLPIWIGLAEADAILVFLEGVEVSRPLTPDLLCAIIDSMGVSVDYIIISDLQDNTFYADIFLHASWRQMEIDARPSDAIAIALRAKAPIYVARPVLEAAGVSLEQEAGRYAIEEVAAVQY